MMGLVDLAVDARCRSKTMHVAKAQPFFFVQLLDLYIALSEGPVAKCFCVFFVVE